MGGRHSAAQCCTGLHTSLLKRFIMGDKQPGKAVAGVERRKWDKNAFAAIAAEKNALDDDAFDREQKNEKQRREAPVQRAPLERDKARDKIGGFLDSTVNKRKMVSVKDTAAPGGAGVFYASVTGKTFHDSLTYLDHINGKKYQREKGQNMRAERSTLSDVKGMLARKTEEKNAGPAEFKGLDERMEEAREHEDTHFAARRDYRERKRDEEQKQLDDQMKNGLDAESQAMAEMMGMPFSFGSSKK